MPSSMVHLLTAYKYDPNASVLFWVSNIAPDCVQEWSPLIPHFIFRECFVISLTFRFLNIFAEEK